MTDKPIISFTKVVTNIEYVGNIPKLEIRHANFKTGSIIVVMAENNRALTFKEMMVRIKFVELTERLVVEKADFETGEITIKVLDHNKAEDLTNKEIDFILNGKIIYAIKSVRLRTNMGLGDAKILCSMWAAKLIHF